MNQSHELLRADHLCKSFTRGVIRKNRVDAVADVSFAIPRGEALGIAGNSGCGKSTIARMLMGLIPPDRGEVWLEGREITGITGKEAQQFHREMQIIFQHPESSLDPGKKILASVMEPMVIHHIGRDREERMEKIGSLFELLGLSEGLYGRYPHQISGGEAQRIIIARALTLEPRLLILDEPTSMLDVSIQAHIMNLLKELQTTLGLTYLLISHDLEVLCWFCSRICVMNQGKLIESGTREQILNEPREPFTRELVESFFL